MHDRLGIPHEVTKQPKEPWQPLLRSDSSPSYFSAETRVVFMYSVCYCLPPLTKPETYHQILEKLHNIKIDETRSAIRKFLHAHRQSEAYGRIFATFICERD
jgi:hypothetical protein